MSSCTSPALSRFPVYPYILPNGLLVAAVPSGPNWTPPPRYTNKKKLYKIGNSPWESERPSDPRDIIFSAEIQLGYV
jgi:hypothetical protein